MEDRKKTGVDWWKKPEHLKDHPKESSNNERRAPKARATVGRRGRVSRPKAPVTLESMSKRVAKHGLIIVGVVVLIALLAHFALTTLTRHGARRTVPQFESLSMVDAERLAANYELNLVINDSLYAPQYAGGIVLDQLPESGSVVKPGRSIYVTVNAMQQKLVPVPYVAERSLRQAKNMLDVSGLSISQLIYREDLATNYVLEQSYNNNLITLDSKMKAPVGSGITLVVGRQEGALTIVPQLLGLSLREAKSALWESGLNVGAVELESGIDITNESQAMVMMQSVVSESECELGSVVSLSLTLSQSSVDSAIKAQVKAKLEAQEMLEMERALTDSLEQILRDLDAKEKRGLFD